MGYIYYKNDLLGSMDEKDRVYINNSIVGYVKDGSLYTATNSLIGYYQDNEIRDINKNLIGNVDAKGNVLCGTSYRGNVSDCENKTGAACALLLLLDFRPEFVFGLNSLKNKEIVENAIEKINNYSAMSYSLEEEDNTCIFNKISQRIDLFLDSKWLELLCVASIKNELFKRVLKVYPDLIKYIKKHAEFERDNHYLNFIIGILSIRGVYFKKNITFGIQQLFKSAQEGFELAINYCQIGFSNTNLINNLDNPFTYVYYKQLGNHDIEQMISYLENKFIDKDEKTTITKGNFSNLYEKTNLGGVLVDKINRINDITISDSWINIINCVFASKEQEKIDETLALTTGITDLVVNTILIDKTSNPYIYYLYAMMNKYGYGVTKNEENVDIYISKAVSLGYDLAILYSHNISTLDFSGEKLEEPVKIKSDYAKIMNSYTQIIEYLRNCRGDLNIEISLYTNQFVFKPKESKEEVKKGKVKVEKNNRKKSRFPLVIGILTLIIIAILIVTFIFIIK